MLILEIEEEQICGGCDTIPNDDGCECRMVSCCECGQRHHIYEMEHPFKDRDDWYEIPLCDKIHEFCCQRCFREEGDEEEQDDESEEEQRRHDEVDDDF